MLAEYSHVQWDVTSKAGNITAIGYDASGKQIATQTIETTGAPASLRASFKDGLGTNGLVAGCSDIALVQV